MALLYFKHQALRCTELRQNRLKSCLIRGACRKMRSTLLAVGSSLLAVLRFAKRPRIDSKQR